MAAKTYPADEGTDWGILCSLDDASHDMPNSAMATGSNSLQSVKKQATAPTPLNDLVFQL